MGIEVQRLILQSRARSGPGPVLPSPIYRYDWREAQSYLVSGITVINAPCCMVLTNGQCTPNQVPCSDRNKYAFFDGFHPTAIVNFLLAIRSYSAQTPFDAYPVDIRSLAQL